MVEMHDIECNTELDAAAFALGICMHDIECNTELDAAAFALSICLRGVLLLRKINWVPPSLK